MGHFISFVLLYPFLMLFRILPLRWAENLGQALIGFIGYRTPKNRRVLHGLRIAFPHKSASELDILARKNWRHYGINFAHAIQLDNPELIHRTDIIGWTHLQQAFDKGKGVLIISAHVGVWDIVCRVIKHKLQAPDTVYRPIDNPYLNRWFEKRRLRVYKSLIPKGPTAGRQILKSIRSGGIVPMMSDQKMWGEISVPYFGVPAETASGAVVLGAKLQVPVIPIHTYKDGDRFKMIISPPMTLTGDKIVDTTHMNQIFETWVTAHPDQYFSFAHNRWN